MHRLIVPGLFEPPDSGGLPDTPLLDHLAGRGDLVREAARDYEQLLAAAFGLECVDTDIPTGALLANFLLEAEPHGQWACVAPVHLHVDRDRLLLFPLQPERIDTQALIGLLNDHFGGDDMRFHATPDGPWLVQTNTPRSVRTCSIDRVAGRSLDPFMPTGEDAGWLRSLMNECQMLLHREHASGDLNSLWFWGFGSLPLLLRQPLEIFSSSLILKAFMKAAPAGAEPGDSSLFVTEQCLQGRHFSDMQRWLGGLEVTANRLRDLLELRGEELVLESDNGIALHYRSPMRFRFWQSGNFADLIQP